ncbi:MAG: chloramphenicol acetyltransferase, partial [Candidatus Cloacimonadota bacterium]
NPAIEIKKRFDKETIEKLLKIKWWDWEIEKITRNVEYLTTNDLNKIVE